MSFFSSIGSFFTNIRDFFAAPATIAAEQNLIATVKEVDMAIVCAIASGSGLASSIMSQVSAGQSISGTTNEVYVISSVVCQALGGTVTGKTATNVPAITAVSPTT